MFIFRSRAYIFSFVKGLCLFLTVFNPRTLLHFNMSYPGYSSIFTNNKILSHNQLGLSNVDEYINL